MQIDAQSITIPGFPQPVSLALENPYEDML